MFKINGEEWKVVAVSPAHPVLLKSNGGYTIGACDDLVKKIYISEDLSGPLMKKVLCHEIAHAAMFSYNVDLTYEEEELLADLMATYGSEIIEITNQIFQKIKNRGNYY